MPVLSVFTFKMASVYVALVHWIKKQYELPVRENGGFRGFSTKRSTIPSSVICKSRSLNSHWVILMCKCLSCENMMLTTLSYLTRGLFLHTLYAS